jgi:hypothetical protein
MAVPGGLPGVAPEPMQALPPEPTQEVAERTVAMADRPPAAASPQTG